MRIVGSLLTLLMVLGFSFAVTEQVNIDTALKELDQTIQQIKDSQETRKQLGKVNGELNAQIKKILIHFTGKKPKLVFELPDGQKILYGVNEFGKPYSFPVKKYSQVEQTASIVASTDVSSVKSNLPKVVYAIAGILYVFSSVYFLYMIGYNFRHGNYLYFFIDLGIWIVSTAIMWKMLKEMLASL